MLTERSDIEKTEELTSAQKTGNGEVYDVSEKNIIKSIKKGLSAPYAKVLIRLTIALILVASLGIFASALIKYNELENEKKQLEKEKEELTLEVEELRYLIDCPIDYDYIIRVAKEKLNLYLPDEIVYYNDYNE